MYLNSAGSPTGVAALGWQGPYLVGFPSAERHAWVTASQGQRLLKQLQNNTLQVLGAHGVTRVYGKNSLERTVSV